MTQSRRPTALVTGGSRGVGEATALALADRGFDVAITYRNKAARAEKVLEDLALRGARTLAVGGNMVETDAVERLFTEVAAWTDRRDVLVLNASGGLERDLLAADPEYPMRLNRDAQLAALAGEQALRERIAALGAEGIRLIVVSGDLVEGTITATLLERKRPGLAADRRDEVGELPTAAAMGAAIARAATDPALPSGETVVVGGAIETLALAGARS